MPGRLARAVVAELRRAWAVCPWQQMAAAALAQANQLANSGNHNTAMRMP